jgi:hypothetical protein
MESGLNLVKIVKLSDASIDAYVKAQSHKLRGASEENNESSRSG